MKSKNIFVLMMVFAVSFTANAEFAAVLGARSNTASTNITGASTSSRLGYMAGVLGWLPLRKSFGVRTGFLYNQRFVSLGPTLQGDIDVNFSYFDIPLTGTYQFNTQTWAFVGPVLAFNQSRDVTCSRNSSCSAADSKSFILPWQLGVDFKFAPQFGAEIFYEFMSGDLAAGVSDMRAIGASALIFFE